MDNKTAAPGYQPQQTVYEQQPAQQSVFQQQPVQQQGVYEQQPIHQQPTTPAQPTYSKQVGGEQEWQNGLFDCFEGADNLCLKGTFCPCFVYGKTSARLHNPTLQGYERINSDCMTWGGLQFCCGVGWAVQFMQQGQVRQQYGIRGDAVTDCLLSWCCGCCALIRMEKEVIGRQQQAGLTQGYQAPGGMVAEPKTQ